MSTDHRAQSADLDICVRIDGKDAAPDRFCLRNAVSVSNDHIIRKAPVQSGFITIREERRSFGKPSLFGNADQRAVIGDLKV